MDVGRSALLKSTLADATRSTRPVMEAAGAPPADGNADNAQDADPVDAQDAELTEELQWLLMRERMPRYNTPDPKWGSGYRSIVAQIMLAVCVHYDWKLGDLLMSCVSRALAIADRYYSVRQGFDTVRLTSFALARVPAGRCKLNGRADILSRTEVAYSFWWVAIKAAVDNLSACEHNAKHGPFANEFLFPRYFWLQKSLEQDHDIVISAEHMKAFEFELCFEIDWNVNMPTMHDFLNLYMQHPWTKYDLDATKNTPTEETLRLLKHWVEYTSAVLMMDPLDMMLQYDPSQCAAAVLLIARVLSLITPSWTPELTTRTLGAFGAFDQMDSPLGQRSQWFVCVHEMGALVVTSLEEGNNQFYHTRLHVKMDVTRQLNRLKHWLEFNSLDMNEVDIDKLITAEEKDMEDLLQMEEMCSLEPATKKPKVGENGRKSMFTLEDTRRRLNLDKEHADTTKNICAAILAKNIELWSNREVDVKQRNYVAVFNIGGLRLQRHDLYVPL